MCTRKKDVDGLGRGFEVYKSLHRIMSDVAMLLMTDAKLMIYKNNSDHLHKTVVRFSSYTFLSVFISEYQETLSRLSSRCRSLSSWLSFCLRPLFSWR